MKPTISTTPSAGAAAGASNSVRTPLTYMHSPYTRAVVSDPADGRGSPLSARQNSNTAAAAAEASPAPESSIPIQLSSPLTVQTRYRRTPQTPKLHSTNPYNGTSGSYGASGPNGSGMNCVGGSANANTGIAANNNVSVSSMMNRSGSYSFTGGPSTSGSPAMGGNSVPHSPLGAGDGSSAFGGGESAPLHRQQQPFMRPAYATPSGLTVSSAPNYPHHHYQHVPQQGFRGSPFPSSNNNSMSNSLGGGGGTGEQQQQQQQYTTVGSFGHQTGGSHHQGMTPHKTGGSYAPSTFVMPTPLPVSSGNEDGTRPIACSPQSAPYAGHDGALLAQRSASSNHNNNNINNSTSSHSYLYQYSSSPVGYGAPGGSSSFTAPNVIPAPQVNSYNSSPRAVGSFNVDKHSHTRNLQQQQQQQQQQQHQKAHHDDAASTSSHSCSSASSVMDNLPLCPNDDACALINDNKHQRKFAHTCRLFPCYHAHIRRHAKLFRHTAGQMAQTEGVNTAKITTHALTSVNFATISPEAPNAYRIYVSHRDKSYEIYGDWSSVKVHTFKRYLHQVYHIAPQAQVLMIAKTHKVMDDEISSVKSYGIEQDSVIQLSSDVDSSVPRVPIEDL